MRFAYFCVLVLVAGASARRMTFNEHMMPIRIVETSSGTGHHDRIDYIKAEIHARHLTTKQRINFRTSGPIETYWRAISEPGDERGHLIASQFSGPAKWYNLSPQNVRVNRNVGFQAITLTWFEAECQVRRFLKKGGKRKVDWSVNMRYRGQTSRPHDYHLVVNFYENGKVLKHKGINTTVKNPLQKEDSTFWFCRKCRSSNHSGGTCSKK